MRSLLDRFVDVDDTRRPHRSLPKHAATETDYRARPRATAGSQITNPHSRVRRDRIDDAGAVTIRHNGGLHHIGVGETHARTHVMLLVQDLHIRVVDAATGELLRELVLDPTRDYQPTGNTHGRRR